MQNSLLAKRIKYPDIIQENKAFEGRKKSNNYSINVVSNITNFQLCPILEYVLNKNFLHVNTIEGEYDNIVQDSFNLEKKECVIIFWEVINFSNDFIKNYNKFSLKEKKDFINQKKNEILLVIQNLSKTKLVLFNNFHLNTHVEDKKEYFNNLVEELNNFLHQNITENIKIIDLNKIFSANTKYDLVNLEKFEKFKMLYTLDFYWEYIEEVVPTILSLNGKSKKVIILDCDNTLWNGVLGEDGFDNIKMSKKNKIGKIFYEVQTMLMEYANEGVLLALCSKNNIEDVEEVMLNHKDMILNNNHIVLKEVNWNNKVDNIKKISSTLNLNLDSFIFLDDSDFEINLVETYLPQVKAIKVPENLENYPELIKELKKLFYQFSYSSEDKNRTEKYKQRAKRIEHEATFTDVNQFLKSLKQKIVINIDNLNIVERLSQISQKTNQFNLNTKRLSVSETKQLINSNKCSVFSLSHSDQFGDSGVTGLAILFYNKDYATIDQFMMSCRIIGRRVEEKFLENILMIVKKQNIKRVKASFSQTSKNNQVRYFYDKNNFLLLTENKLKKEYECDLDNYTIKKNDNIIEVINE